ncbi:MAG: DUF3298 and DUF4163 domain-containing protein [Ruminococcaceae bacterium]|nr:DUF3298 and DUF4163 domain-containing protein [Oscillospiraceae bacterium]
MKNCSQCLEIETLSAQREWTADGIPVLRADISLPCPISPDCRIRQRIERFYQLQRRSYLRYCENWLAPKAAADCRQALADSAPLPQYTARLTYQVTCNEAGILSLFTDSQEFTGGRTLVLRRGDTWDLQTGYPLPATAFFPRRTFLRKLLLRTAADEIRRQENAGLSRYAESWPQAMKRTWNRSNFYITPDSFCFFWQMYTIAPASEGIPVFSIPFCSGLCVSPFPLDETEKSGAADDA